MKNIKFRTLYHAYSPRLPERQAGTAQEISEQKKEIFLVVNLSPSFSSSSLEKS
jgi:hypothetical protein